MFHGDNGFLLAQAWDESSISGTEIGGVLGSGRGHRGSAQRARQPPVAVTGLARSAFAGGFVMARAHPGPGRQVRSGAEAAHVGAGLGDDDLGDGLAHPRDRRQVLKLAGKREHLLLNARRQFPDRRGELVDALQMQPAQKRMVFSSRGLRARLARDTNRRLHAVRRTQ